MLMDLIVQSQRNLLRRPGRTALLFGSVWIGALMICIIVCASGCMETVLLSMLARSTNVEKQVFVYTNEQIGGWTEPEELYDVEKITDIRIEVLLPITETRLLIGDMETDELTPFFYDGEYSLFTEGESRTLLGSGAGHYDKEGVILNPFFLAGLGLKDYIPSEGDKVELTYMLKDGSFKTITLPVLAVMKDNEYGVINKKNHADLFVNIKELPVEDMIFAVRDSVLLEFATYEDAKEAADRLEAEGKEVKLSDENISIVKADTIVYRTICRILEVIIMFSVTGCVFIMFTMEYEEKESFWGILKAVGYTNGMLFLVSLFQVLAVSILCGGVAYFIVLTAGNGVLEYFIKSILFSGDGSFDLSLHFSVKDWFSVVGLVFASGFVGAAVSCFRILRLNFSIAQNAKK